MKKTMITAIACLAIASSAHARQGCAAPFIGWGNLGQALPPQGTCMGIAAGRGFVVQLQLDGTLTASGGISQPPQGQFLAVAGGLGHAAAIRADRRVVAWGFNHYGQTNVPPELPDAAKVTTTYDNSAIIDVNGVIHVWGWTAFGLTTRRPEPMSRSTAENSTWSLFGLMATPSAGETMTMGKLRCLLELVPASPLRRVAASLEKSQPGTPSSSLQMVRFTAGETTTTGSAMCRAGWRT